MADPCIKILTLLWQISWQASVVAAVVLLLRRLPVRVLNCRVRHALWILVLIRLIAPVFPESRVSLFSLGGFFNRPSTLPPPVEIVPLTEPRPVHVSITYSGIRPATVTKVHALPTLLMPEAKPRWPQWFTAAWLLIALSLITRRVWVNWRFNRALKIKHTQLPDRLKSALDETMRLMRVRREPQLLVTDAVGAPAVAGVWRPRILLPWVMARELTDDQLRLVLLHELAHIKSRDVAIDWLWAVVQSLHWFNPILWMIGPIRRNDREMARDERVLALSDVDQTACYGNTLIELAQSAHRSLLHPGLIGILGSRHGLQRRIEMIAGFNSARRGSVWMGIVLAAFAGCCTLTSPQHSSTTATVTQPAAAKRSNSGPARQLDADASLQAKLDRPFESELRFDAVPLDLVMVKLREVSGINIYVDWPGLSRGGISKTAPVTARFREMKFSKALELIFKCVEGSEDEQKLGYAVDEGVLTISTIKELNKNTITRRYDVSDLLFIPPDYNSVPDLSLRNGAPTTGQSLFNNSGTPQPDQQQDRQTRVDELKHYIIDNVEPKSWKDNGGSVGQISASTLRAVLLITQTPRAHKQIQDVLDDLRNSRAKQVSVEMRFVALDEAAEAKLPESLRHRLASVRHAGQFRRDEFLSNDEVKQLLAIVSADAATTSVTVPRLTLFDGQHAALVVQTQQAYVANLNEIHSKDAEGKQVMLYEPVVETCTATGVVAKLTACSTPDGKNVFVDLQNQTARLTAMLTERFPEKIPGIEGRVQRPVTEIFKVDAACGIPDQATLLLGTKLEFTAGDPAFNKDSPDRAATDEKVKQLREQASHRHEYLLVKPTILVSKPKAPAFPLQNAKKSASDGS